jgi:hypothetical protein
MSTKTKLFAAFVLVLIGVFGRTLPHVWNIAPLAAISLISGSYLGYRYGIFVPLGALIIGDLFLGFYSVNLALVVYGSFAMIGTIGYLIRKSKNAPTFVLASVGSSILFYLVTNFAVWQFSPFYEKSIGGLLTSYTLALPFFRNTLVGDLWYTLLLYAAAEVVCYAVSRRKQYKKALPSASLVQK